MSELDAIILHYSPYYIKIINNIIFISFVYDRNNIIYTITLEKDKIPIVNSSPYKINKYTFNINMNTIVNDSLRLIYVGGNYIIIFEKYAIVNTLIKELNKLPQFIINEITPIPLISNIQTNNQFIRKKFKIDK